MADNVDITAGAGTTVHADEYDHGTLGSGKTQLVKLVDGTLDSDTPIGVPDIGAKANALRVCPANDITDATYIGDIKFGEALATVTNLAQLGGQAVSMGEGVVAAGCQRVTLATDDDGVAHLATIAGAVAATHMQCDIIAGTVTTVSTVTNLSQMGGIAISMNEGVLGTGVQRVSLATDDDAVAHLATIAGAVSTQMQCDIVAALPAGDNNIGNVDVVGGTITTVSTVTSLSQMGGVAITMGEGVLDGGCQRVTLATDDDGVAHLNTIAGAVAATHMQCDIVAGTVTTVSTVTTCSTVSAITSLDKALYVDDGAWTGDTSSHFLVGGIYQSTPQTITDGKSAPLEIDVNGKLIVSGVTACNTGAVVLSSGTVTTVSTVTNLSQMSGTAITMDEGVHGTGCQRVTIATDDDGVLSLGIIDDWDSTHDSAASADGPQLMAAYDATKPAAVGDGDAVRVLADEYGRLLAGVEKTAWQEDYDSADASAEAEVVKASAASTVIVVQSYIISVDTEMWVKLQEQDSTALTGKMWLKAGGGVAITLPDKCPLILGTDSDLEVITEGAGNISVSATGYTIPGA